MQRALCPLLGPGRLVVEARPTVPRLLLHVLSRRPCHVREPVQLLLPFIYLPCSLSLTSRTIAYPNRDSDDAPLFLSLFVSL